MALIYRSTDRWQIWVAFAGAIFLHLAALALAETRVHDASPVPVTASPDVVGHDEIAVEIQPPSDPAELQLPDAPIPPDPTFFDEQTTPPPVRRPRLDSVRPIARPASVARAVNMSGAKAFALSAPRPDYPYEARRRQLTGSGVATLHVDPASGNVVDVEMTQSTGSPILDGSAISAFRRWRFKPGTLERVRTPITYQLNGASY